MVVNISGVPSGGEEDGDYHNKPYLVSPNRNKIKSLPEVIGTAEALFCYNERQGRCLLS